MATKKIVFLDANTFPPKFEIPRPKIAHHWQQYRETSALETAVRIADAEVVITNKVSIKEKEIAQAKKLELVVVTATGFDHIDLQAARKRKIAVCNSINYGTPSIAEHAFMLMLMLVRNALRYSKAIENHRWQQSPSFCIFDYPVFELRGKTLAICGMGNVGLELERMAMAFGMHVLRVERKESKAIRPGYTAFSTALSQADILSLNLPLNTQTTDMIAGKELAMMKKSAYIVNVARGGVVNEVEVARALQSAEIAGIAFDVLCEEPPQVKNNQHVLLSLLANADLNIVISPHIAWAGENSLQTIVAQCVENIDSFYSGIRLRRLD